jgi:hypothetical protein
VIIYWVFILGFGSLFFGTANAQSVSSFSASPSSMNSGRLATFTWTTSNTSGVNFKISSSCPTGLVVYKEDNTELECGAKVTGLPTNSGYSVKIVNFTQNTVTVTGMVIPKDGNGDEVTSAQTEASVSVLPASDAFASFSSSPVQIASGSFSKISWDGYFGVSGANLIYDCVQNILVSESTNFDSANRKQCGSLIFSSVKGASTFGTLYFKNEGVATTTVNVKIVPYIDGAYNTYFVKTVDVVVNPPAAAATTPKIESFTASPALVESEGSAVISWSSSNTAGVNLRIQNCASEITYSTSTPSIFKSCSASTNVFGDGVLGTSGSYTIVFKTSRGSSPVELTLIPATASGVYDMTQIKTVSITVKPKSISAAPSSAAPSAPSVPSVPSAPAVSSAAVTRPSGAQDFEDNLYYGLRNHRGVLGLQHALAHAGVFRGPFTGNFFSLTRAAVKKFQADHNISATGFVGPLTRAQLNTLGYYWLK